MGKPLAQQSCSWKPQPVVESGAAEDVVADTVAAGGVAAGALARGCSTFGSARGVESSRAAVSEPAVFMPLAIREPLVASELPFSTRELQSPTRELQSPTRELQSPTRELQSPTRELQSPTREEEESSRRLSVSVDAGPDDTARSLKAVRLSRVPTHDTEAFKQSMFTSLASKRAYERQQRSRRRLAPSALLGNLEGPATNRTALSSQRGMRDAGSTERGVTGGGSCLEPSSWRCGRRSPSLTTSPTLTTSPEPPSASRQCL